MRDFTKADLVEAVRIFNASSRLYRFNRDTGFIEPKATDDPVFHSQYYREIEAAFSCFLLEYDLDMGEFQIEAAESRNYSGMMRRIRGGEAELMRTLLGALEATLERAPAYDAAAREELYEGAYDPTTLWQEEGAPDEGDRIGGPPGEPTQAEELARLTQVADLLLVEDGRPQEGMPEEYEDEFPLAVDYFRAHRFEAADLNDRRESFTHLFNRSAAGIVPNEKFWNSSQITIRATPALFGAVRCAIGYS